MAKDEIMLYQHADGRWVQLVIQPRRIDQMEGERGVGRTCEYRIYKTAEGVAMARSRARGALQDRGFRHVKKLRGFAPVPVERWREVSLVGKPRKSVLRGPAKNALEAAVAHLEAVPGVVLGLKRGKPATAKALAAAEKRIGRPLPPSLRAFFAEHDGLVVEWRYDEYGWGVALEIFSLREMLKEWAFRGDEMLKSKAGWLLPLSPTYDRAVLGALLREKGEAKIIESRDPPDGPVDLLAPDFATFLARAAKNYFVLLGRKDVSVRRLPEMRKQLKRRRG